MSGDKFPNLVYIAKYFNNIMSRLLMQCNDTCPMEDGWDSMIDVGDREAQFVYITWTADTQSSIYVVQYRLRNTQIYSSSLEVRDLVYMIIEGIQCYNTVIIQISSTHYNITQLRPETDYEIQVCRATSTSSSDDCGNCLFCVSTIDQAQGKLLSTGTLIITVI